MSTAQPSDSPPKGGSATVSVVIPARDDARFLRRCLLALESQTVTPVEVIVVDNLSSDETAEVARRHGAIVVSESQVGIPAASARGYDTATGTLIARLDADSVPPHDWIERVLAAFARRPGLDAVSGPGVLLDERDRRHRVASAAFFTAYFLGAGAALAHPPLFGSAMALRRAAWLDVRDDVCRDDSGVHDDLDLALHLGARHTVGFDRRLAVLVSARLASPVGGPRRWRRGFRSLTKHWPEEGPVTRYARLLTAILTPGTSRTSP